MWLLQCFGGCSHPVPERKEEYGRPESETCGRTTLVQGQGERETWETWDQSKGDFKSPPLPSPSGTLTPLDSTDLDLLQVYRPQATRHRGLLAAHTRLCSSTQRPTEKDTHTHTHICRPPTPHTHTHICRHTHTHTHTHTQQSNAAAYATSAAAPPHNHFDDH